MECVVEPVNNYVSQLEQEIESLKKKLEEKSVNKYNSLNIKSLTDITEDNPMIVIDKHNKPLYKLVLAYRNKRTGHIVMKIMKRNGFFWNRWEYKEVMGRYDDWIAFPISYGSQSSDKVNNILKNSDIDIANGFFRMLESIGLIDRNNLNFGM